MSLRIAPDLTPRSPLARDWQWARPPEDPEDDGASHPRDVFLPGEGEDLPYKVELWDETGNFVEQVLAVTANGTIGHAAFCAATREFPHRYVTLRHKGNVVSRWNGPSH